MKNKILDNLPTLFVVMIVAFSFIMVFNHAYSETQDRVVLINSGKAGGSFNARTQMYKEGLIAAGYNVQFENIGKISQAVKMFKESNQPTIMVYANNQVYKQDLFHTESNFIIAELILCYDKVALCVKQILFVHLIVCVYHYSWLV